MFEPLRRRKAFGPVLLTLSLALNLFMVGWGVTQGLSAADTPGPDPAPEVAAAMIARDLPKADGDMLLEAVAARRAPLQEARRAYLASRDAVRHAIASEPLDEAAMRDAIAKMRAARQAERTLFGDTIFDVLAHMSAQGRQAFVTSAWGAVRERRVLKKKSA